MKSRPATRAERASVPPLRAVPNGPVAEVAVQDGVAVLDEGL